MKKFLNLLLGAALVVCMAAPGIATAGQTRIPLKISHHPYLHALPSIYASENGLYDIYDYTIDYYAGGPVQNEAIASGAWEIGTTGITGAVLGITGYNMKVLGVVFEEANTTDMWCRKSSPLASAKRSENGVLGTADDWRGLTVLIATGTNTHLTLIAALESLGLSEKDVNIVDCSSVPNIYTAFLSGQGDVACVWAPYGYSLMADSDYVKVGSLADLGVSLPVVTVCTEEAYKNRPEVVEQWLGIFYRAADALMADTAAGAKMMYDFSEEQGIVMSEEAARLEFTERSFWSAADNIELFTARADGTTIMYERMMNYAKFMLSQGKLTQAQYDKMAKTDFISDIILSVK